MSAFAERTTRGALGTSAARSGSGIGPAPPVTRLVDAHHHLWDLAINRYPWLQGPPAPGGASGVGKLQRNYVVADFLADAAGLPLAASVHVEAAFDPGDPVRETRWLQDVADRDGFPDAIVAAARLEQPGVRRVLSAHCESPNVRGIRQMLDRDLHTGMTAETPLLDDASWRAGLQLLGEMGLSFDLQILPSQLEASAGLADDFAGTVFLLNHGGYHVPRSALAERDWRRGIKALADCPNVAVKVSGYDAVDPTWAPSGNEDFVLSLVEAFGTDRSMFASNFPVDGRTITYVDLVALTSWALRDHAADDRDRFFFANAERYYRLSPRPPAGSPALS
jgi:predicted TIM-barrel fold metal-dependent hydrolase